MRTLDNTTPRNLQQSWWLVQPRWVRIYTVAVVLGAWLPIAANEFARVPFMSEALEATLGIVFASAVLLQMVVVARAYIREEL